MELTATTRGRKRDVPTNATAVSYGADTPLFTVPTGVTGVDHPTDYKVNAYVERRRVSLNTNYETETLVSVAFLIRRNSSGLTTNIVSTNVPGDTSISVTDSN